MRVIALIGLLAVASPAYGQLCGPAADFESKTVKEKSPIELAPETNKATVYVIEVGAMFPTDRFVSIDRQWVGVLRSNNYMVVAVEPGKRALCSVLPKYKGIPSSRTEITFETGKTYYVQIDSWQSHMSEVSSEDARVLMKSRKRRVFWIKGQQEPD